jgi:hypothetical protein
MRSPQHWRRLNHQGSDRGFRRSPTGSKRGALTGFEGASGLARYRLSLCSTDQMGARRLDSIPIGHCPRAVQFNRLYPKCPGGCSPWQDLAGGTSDTILCVIVNRSFADLRLGLLSSPRSRFEFAERSRVTRTDQETRRQGTTLPPGLAMVDRATRPTVPGSGPAGGGTAMERDRGASRKNPPHLWTEIRASRISG